MASGYRFQGISIAEDGSDPLRDLSRYPREGPGKAPHLFHLYRIHRKTPGGLLLVREVWNDELPVGPGLECHWESGRCGGLSFLAFNPHRDEVYLTLVADAARVVTRELFAVSMRTGAIRRLGEFSTAGDTFTGVGISPSGHYLAFLGLRGSEVIQGLTLVETESGKRFNLPSDEEAKAFTAKCPGWGLNVLEYRWKGRDQVVYLQRAEPPSGGSARPCKPIRKRRVPDQGARP